LRLVILQKYIFSRLVVAPNVLLLNFLVYRIEIQLFCRYPAYYIHLIKWKVL